MVLPESIALDNLKIFNLVMKNDVPTGRHGVHGASALQHVAEGSKAEHVNVQKRINVLAITKMLNSVAEMNVVSIQSFFLE